MSRPKRAIDVVDLTGDDDGPQKKVARVPERGNQHRRANQDPRASTQNDEDDADNIIDLTNDGEEFGSAFSLVGRMEETVVGLRYYDGFATRGEAVMIVREPRNQYDSNAIRVNNVQGTQIGHLPRGTAAKLAPYMDRRLLMVEGVLSGEKGFYDCPISLTLWTTSEPAARAAVEARMKADRLPVLKPPRGPAPKKSAKLANPHPGRRPSDFTNALPSSGPGLPQQAIPEQAGPSREALIGNSQHFRPREIEELVGQWGTPEDKLASMPIAQQPAAIQATLLPYQLQGLAWMLAMEKPELPLRGTRDVVQLWKRSTDKADLFTNIATNFTTAKAPVLARGGILADDMGLGKTLQVISLIIQGGPGTTLIIAPVSVMSNWSQQIQKHVKTDKALKILTYHGSGRKTMGPAGFSSYDVVITTYGTLGIEYMPSNSKTPGPIPRKQGLFSMEWKRVVLDEGHQIRNPSTKSAIAACSLLAQARWVLSGTPIVNSVKDLFSMLKFLRITGGLEKAELFNSILTRPLSNGDPQADLLLQSIMRTLCLRRRKDMKFIDLRLPELTEYVHRFPFRPEEREKYNALQAEAMGMLQKVQSGRNQANGKGLDTYRHLLEILLRLRQVCCHWRLCGGRITNLMELLESQEIVKLTPENRLALQAILQLSIDSSEECAVCLDDLHNPVITTCKHVFGYECIERVINGQHKCPMCRAALDTVDQLVRPAVEPKLSDEPKLDIDTQSSKTEALLSILKATRRDPKSKIVIFSQWTSFLDIVQRQLDEHGFTYARIDGTMSAPARDAAMTALETDPQTTVLLASLAVCSVGLNLVAADTVILADSWWAPAIEDQAVDRVHRLGQTRPTTVWRLVVEDTIEERVLEIQAQKRGLVGKAFQEKGGKRTEASAAARMADIKKLLG